MQASSFMETVLESIEKDALRQKKLVSEPSYMEWLYEYTKANPKITDWLLEYRKDFEHYEQYNSLVDLYAAVENFNEKNGFEPYSEDHDVWYNVKYKDAYFMIGICRGQGMFCFLERLSKEPERYTEFSAIMEDAKDSLRKS